MYIKKGFCKLITGFVFALFFGMLFLGFVLGIGFKLVQITKNYFYIGIYSLILTYSVLGVETGILDIQVLLYFAIAILIYLTDVIKTRD